MIYHKKDLNYKGLLNLFTFTLFTWFFLDRTYRTYLFFEKRDG